MQNHYPTSDYHLIGSRFKPRGITGNLTRQQLAHLQSNAKTKWLSVEQVEGQE